MPRMLLETALLPDGWHDNVLVSIEAGRLAAVELQPSPEAVAGAEPIAGVTLPAIGNLHSHTFQRGFAGLTERRGAAEDHFWTWRAAMYRFVGLLTPDDVEAIAAQAFVEMLEQGFSAVAEFHYLHHRPDGRPYDDPAEMAGRIAAAAEATGIGLTLLPVFYAHAGFSGQPPAPGQRRFVCDLAGFEQVVEGARQVLRTMPEARLGVAPHSLRAATLDEIAALVRHHPEGPIQIHVAEQEVEVADCIAATGARPVEWLLANAPVGARWCLIHATHMTQTETEALARSEAVAGLCPVTESNLGDGIFPATAYAEAAGRFGVGSDSNVLISLQTELRTLEYSQRLRDRARNRLAGPERSTGRSLYDSAAAGGAQALGRPHGAIAAGQIADLLVLDPRQAALYGRRGDNLLDAWVFAAPHPAIEAVYVAGRRVVEHGRHPARDAVADRFRRSMDRLASAL